jgi:hypothetical protein
MAFARKTQFFRLKPGYDDRKRNSTSRGDETMSGVYYLGKEESHVGQAFWPDTPAPSGQKA